MSYEPLAIQEDDYVIPFADDDEFDNKGWTPCRVIRIYANGNLWARSDKGDLSWRGPVSAFKLAP